MALPTKEEAQILLEKHVQDEYQKYHAAMVASALMACDEISGIFYAYRKLNPIPYGEMKVSSIKKRLAEKSFAAKIDRESIYRGCEALGVALDEHITNLIKFFSGLK
jgi:predicted hydrolase (HD superfamily)